MDNNHEGPSSSQNRVDGSEQRTSVAVSDGQYPRPHRCNPELEEIIQSLFRWPIHLGKPFRDFIHCLRNKPEERK